MQRVKNRNISENINPVRTKFEDQPPTALREWSNMIQIKSNMAAGRHLEKIDMTS